MSVGKPAFTVAVGTTSRVLSILAPQPLAELSTTVIKEVPVEVTVTALPEPLITAGPFTTVHVKGPVPGTESVTPGPVPQ